MHCIQPLICMKLHKKTEDRNIYIYEKFKKERECVPKTKTSGTC